MVYHKGLLPCFGRIRFRVHVIDGDGFPSWSWEEEVRKVLGPLLFVGFYAVILLGAGWVGGALLHRLWPRCPKFLCRILAASLAFLVVPIPERGDIYPGAYWLWLRWVGS